MCPWEIRRHWAQPVLSSQKTPQGDYDCNGLTEYLVSGHEPQGRLDTKADRLTFSCGLAWTRSVFSPSATQMGRPMAAANLTKWRQTTGTPRHTDWLTVGYTVIPCFFRRLFLHNRFVIWRKFDLWQNCTLKERRPPHFEHWPYRPETCDWARLKCWMFLYH